MALPIRFSNKILYEFFFPHACYHVSPISSWFNRLNNTRQRLLIMMLFFAKFSSLFSFNFESLFWKIGYILGYDLKMLVMTCSKVGVLEAVALSLWAPHRVTQMVIHWWV
jgi:hypothetical protein